MSYTKLISHIIFSFVRTACKTRCTPLSHLSGHVVGLELVSHQHPVFRAIPEAPSGARTLNSAHGKTGSFLGRIGRSRRFGVDVGGFFGRILGGIRSPLVHVNTCGASACDGRVTLARSSTGVDSPVRIGHGGSAEASCTSAKT